MKRQIACSLIISALTLPTAPPALGSGSPTILFFSEIPAKRMEHSIVHDVVITFYQWMNFALSLHAGSRLVVADPETVVALAKARGARPVELRNDKNKLTHLAFEDSDLELLYDLAAKEGIRYLVQGRLVGYEEQKQYMETRKKYGPFTVTSTGPTTTWEIAVELTVHDTGSRRTVSSRRVETAQQGLFRAEDRARKAVIDALVSDISAGTRSLSNDIPAAKVAVNRSQHFMIRVEEGGTIRYRAAILALVSVERLGSNLVRANFSFRNPAEERLLLEPIDRDGPLRATRLETDDRVRYGLAEAGNFYGVEFRAGERKDFFLLFDAPPPYAEQINLFSFWRIRRPGQAEEIEAAFPQLALH